MPFLRLDEDGFEENEEGDIIAFTGDFAYHTPAEYAYKPHPFEPAKLRAVSKVALELLRSLGVTHFRVRYDGGHDEGFAHAERVRTAAGTTRSIEDVIAELATPDRLATLRAAAAATDGERVSVWHDPANHYGTAGDAQTIRDALDELGNEIVGALLGNGYGTGEYAMYGAITADLATGQLTDESENVPRPPDSTLDSL